MPFPYRQVIPAIWGICFALFVITRMLRLRKYLDERPRSADPSAGHTNRVRVMWETLYVTDAERVWFEHSNRLVRIFVLLGFIAFLIGDVVLPLMLLHS